MERCGSEEFYFDPTNNIFAIQVSDSFDTSQAMMLGDLFRAMHKTNSVNMYSFTTNLEEVMGKKDWCTRYEELKHIPIPCLLLFVESERYSNVSDYQYATNLINMFKKDKAPAIYLGQRNLGHIHRKAEAIELNSFTMPLSLNNQPFYRFTENSVYGFTYGKALLMMFNPFVPILRPEEVYQKPKYRDGYVSINKDMYAKYKAEIVRRIGWYSLWLSQQIETMIANKGNGLMCTSCSLFMQSGLGLFIGTPVDYNTYKQYQVFPYKSENETKFEQGIYVRKTKEEVLAEKKADDLAKTRYAIAEKRLDLIDELLRHTPWKGWTALSLCDRDRIEESFDKDNSQYIAWINSNVRHLRSGWWTEAELLDLLNNRGKIPTSYGLLSYWGQQVEKLSNNTYKRDDFVGPKYFDESAEYKLKVKLPNGTKKTFDVTQLQELAVSLGYKQKDITVKHLEQMLKLPVIKGKYIKYLDNLHQR